MLVEAIHKEGNRELQLRCLLFACPVRCSGFCPQYKLCIVAQAYNPRFKRQRQDDQDFKGYLLVYSKFEATATSKLEATGLREIQKREGEGGREEREGESQGGPIEGKQKEGQGEGSRGWEVER
jgi:hypothetical protein